MNRATATRKLAKLGFEIDWNTTGPGDGYWSGNIDPIGYVSIGGDCFGPVVHGRNASDWYANALAEAERLARFLQPCTDPGCEMHAGAEAREEGE